MGVTHFSGVSVTDRNSSIGQKDVIDRVKVIRIQYSDGTGEIDTGWDLPSTAVVEDVFVNVITAEATGSTKTIDVGLLSTESGGDADGLLDGISVASTGLKGPSLTITETTGTNERYISAVTSTYGVLLGQLDYELGTDTAGDTGYANLVPKRHINTNGNSISWTPGSNDFAELVADIIILYKEIV